jgi:hypothetical protein
MPIPDYWHRSSSDLPAPDSCYLTFEQATLALHYDVIFSWGQTHAIVILAASLQWTNRLSKSFMIEKRD